VKPVIQLLKISQISETQFLISSFLKNFASYAKNFKKHGLNVALGHNCQ